MAFFRSCSMTSLVTIVNLIVTLVAISLATGTVQSQHYGKGTDTAVMDDYDETDNPLDTPNRTPTRLDCNAKVRQRCCHLRTHITIHGSIKVKRPQCPERYIMQCCPIFRGTRRYGPYNGNATKITTGGGTFGVGLGDIVGCVQSLITNLLQFRLTLRPKEGGQGGCCQLPILKLVC